MNTSKKYSTWTGFAKSVLAALAVAAAEGPKDVRAAGPATYTYTSTSSSGAYLTAGNWSPAGPPGAGDIAYFNTAGSTNAGINFNSGTNYNSTSLTGTYNGVAFGHNEGVGTIEVGTTEAAASLTIGNSSSSAASTNVNGTLSLNGNTINSVANVVLDDASTTTLNLANYASGITSGPGMLVNLGNTTNNVVLIDGTGNINISANIISPVANGQLTLSRSASSTGTGALILGGNNIYSGGTTVTNGNLVVTNATGTSATGTGTVTVGTNAGASAVLSGTGFITGAVTTATTGSNVATLAPGVNSNTTNLGGVGTLTLGGGLTAGSGTNFNFDLASTATATSDLISLSGTGTTRALTLGSTLTFNYSLLTAGNLATGSAYTLISGATNTLSLSGVTISSTGLGTYTPSYSVSGGSLLVTFSSPNSPNYFGTTGQGYNTNSTVFNTTTADFNSKNDGTGTAKAFDPSRTAIFGGTPGTVTVGTVTANAGLQFTSTGYTLTGGTLTLATVPTVEVTNATDTATINTTLSGTAGLTKNGAGNLVLGSTASNFTGGVTVNAGRLSVSQDANLGDPSNGVTLAGGTLAATTGFTTARGLAGSGSLDVANGALLAATGTINTTALTLTNSGTLDLQAATPSLGALTIAAPGTLESTTGGTIGLTGLTAPNLSGTATISASLTLPSGASGALNVGAGGNLVLSGIVTTYPTITKTGAGTLELDGLNTGLYQVQIGTASTTTPVAGGTVVISNSSALGQKQLYLDNGTINATTDLTSATGNALPNGVSISGIVGSTAGGAAYGAATFSGSNMEFTGASNFYENNAQTVLAIVNNTTTLSGAIAPGGSKTGKGILITSTNNGTLIISGSANTFTDAITIGGSATLVAANTGALALNTSITVNTGGTLLLSGTNPDRINDNAAITLAGGTYGSGGNTETTGALTLSSSSSIDFGAGSNASVLTFADSSAKTWSGTLTLLNYTDMADELNFGTSSATGTGGGLTAAQLGEITYSMGGNTYVGSGFDASGDVTFSVEAVPEPATILGGALLFGALGWSQRRRLRGLAGLTRTGRVG